ncbi:MAG: beta-ketoacyl-ACP synthase II [Alkalispirochaeta sp.]
MHERERVAITGLGVCSAVGQTIGEFWTSLTEGRSAAGAIELFDATGHLCRIAAEIPDFDPKPVVGRKRTRRMARFSQMASLSAQQAVDSSGIDLQQIDRTRVGCVIGTAAGDYYHLEEQHQTLLEKGPGNGFPLAVPLIIPNMSSANIAIDLGISGPNFGVTSACSSGAHAVAMGAMLLRSGSADVVIAGGAEAAISPLTVNAYGCMGVLTSRNDDPTHASRPFDADRDGFLIGEGAGVLVLEREADARRRGAEIWAYLDGAGMTADRHSIAIPEPDGTNAARAMEMAMRDGGVNVEKIDYVNAHGTSTVANDRTETIAIKRALGERARDVAVSSTKSMIGHTLGAAGAIEAVATVLTLKHQVIPPTINYETPDPECDLDYVPNTARSAETRSALSNSFGFGGQNCSLLFTAPGQ